MNAVLWTIQGVLAVVFAASGAAKSIMSKERMIASGQTGVAPFPLPVVRVVAACELLGAGGLILPGVVGVASWLTVCAAAGLAIVMLGAAASHWSLSERMQALTVNLPLLVLCVAVVVGRWN